MLKIRTKQEQTRQKSQKEQETAMTSNITYIHKPHAIVEAVPFATMEEAWFWFIQAQQARNDGARFTMGLGRVPRPCEPLDILKIMDRLYRHRRLLMDHLKVLRHYGQRLMPPDRNRVKEMRAHKLWVEALARMEPIFIRKGILQQQHYMEAAE
jgi:hypothetical protein